MRKYRKATVVATQNSKNSKGLNLQLEMPMAELIAQARDEIEALSAQIGLSIL